MTPSTVTRRGGIGNLGVICCQEVKIILVVIYELSRLFEWRHTYKIFTPGLEVIKLEFNLKLKIKRNDWLLVNTC